MKSYVVNCCADACEPVTLASFCSLRDARVYLRDYFIEKYGNYFVKKSRGWFRYGVAGLITSFVSGSKFPRADFYASFGAYFMIYLSESTND